MNLQIFYRISDVGYKKEKLDFVNNLFCLQNFYETSGINYKYYDNIYYHIYLDSVHKETKDTVSELIFTTFSEQFKDNTQFYDINIKSNAQSFKYVMNEALKICNTDDDIYFVENDYIHKSNFTSVIYDALNNLKCSYVTLYDHPDKYKYGANPLVKSDNAEVTKVYLGEYCHFKLTNSTTMTFATKYITLLQDKEIIEKYLIGDYPRDFDMFIDLTKNNKRSLLSSLPAFSTHGEIKWLAPLVNWKKFNNRKSNEEKYFD